MLPIPDVNLGPASALGASMMGSLTLDNFILNSAVLSDDHNRILDEHATRLLDLLRQYPNSFISISGHTDATGREDRNQPLSRERAETVKQALIARGIPGEIITSSGLGASVLRVDTSQADPRNRRVEIHFTARNLFNLQTRQ
jgi:OOP family OmpA-OmpF porin